MRNNKNVEELDAAGSDQRFDVVPETFRDTVGEAGKA